MEIELAGLMTKEETMWLQRSRTSWLKEGDKNTSFFHRMAKGRHRRNHISRIKDSDGNWIEEEQAIGDIFSDYFKNIFTTKPTARVEKVLEAIQRKVSTLMNGNLTAR